MPVQLDPTGGGQFKPVIQKIIEAESQPVRNLENRKAKEDTRIKLYQEFKTKSAGLDKLLADLSNFHKFRELKVDLGNGESLMNVTLDKDKAEPGVYEMEIGELAVRASSISNGFEDPDKPLLGPGFITMDLPDGGTDEIYIEENQSSLKGIASAINKRRNAPVQASVIKDVADGDPVWKLLITSKKDGEARAVDFPNFYFLDGAVDFYVYDDREANNASLYVDGFPIETDSNDITDFLPGINVHLKQARPDEPFYMAISIDHEKVIGKVKTLLEQVNQILQFIYKQNAIDDRTDTSVTFAGDSTFQSLEYRIRNIFHEGYVVEDDFTEQEDLLYLSHIGIEFDKAGQLGMKTEKFKKFLEDNFNMVADAFTSPNGVVASLRETLSAYTGPGNGFLTVKEQGLRNRVKEIDRQIDQRMRFLDRRKTNLVGQFSRLEASLNEMQKQQAFLSATGGGGGGMMNQLMGG